MTPHWPPSPAPQAPPVSQLRRQLVHVNRKVDVLDQLSHVYGQSSASTVPAGHNRLEVEQHEQVGTQGIHLRCSYILIQCRLCRFGFRSERFGPRSVSVPCTFSFFYLQYLLGIRGSASVVRLMGRLGIPFCFFKLPNHRRVGSWDS